MASPVNQNRPSDQFKIESNSSPQSRFGINETLFLTKILAIKNALTVQSVVEAMMEYETTGVMINKPYDEKILCQEYSKLVWSILKKHFPDFIKPMPPFTEEQLFAALTKAYTDRKVRVVKGHHKLMGSIGGTGNQFCQPLALMIRDKHDPKVAITGQKYVEPQSTLRPHHRRHVSGQGLGLESNQFLVHLDSLHGKLTVERIVKVMLDYESVFSFRNTSDNLEDYLMEFSEGLWYAVCAHVQASKKKFVCTAQELREELRKQLDERQQNTIPSHDPSSLEASLLQSEEKKESYCCIIL